MGKNREKKRITYTPRGIKVCKDECVGREVKSIDADRRKDARVVRRRESGTIEEEWKEWRKSKRASEGASE